ncbi:MAG: tRNA nucleotidyltransferase [Rhodocyclales bacterium]|nr:tRNA nucleotidyltransferase [Rhodocyclales bacterium]
MPAPESVLLAATFNSGGSSIDVFTRDDDNGKWVTTPLIAGKTGVKSEDNSVRAAAVYRDRVTGQEQVFLSVGILGIFTGHYDPKFPGRIRWNRAPEVGTATQTRILSIVEANDSLFFSEGTKIFLVADLSNEVSSGTDHAKFQSIGGIRGCPQ